VPWCEPCGRFLNPNSMGPDGTCPSCGRVLAPPSSGQGGTATATTKVPWHFWLLVIALAVYLGWRAVQGVGWLAAHL
jgi:hypothetical protein